MEFSNWFAIVAIASLGVAGACAIIIIFDLLAGHSQHMWIMNIVWPVLAKEYCARG
jgi:hypothetical protein